MGAQGQSGDRLLDRPSRQIGASSGAGRGVYPGGRPDIGARHGTITFWFLEWIFLVVSYVPFRHGLDCNELHYNIFAPKLGVNWDECQARWRVAAHGARRAYIAILSDVLPHPPSNGPLLSQLVHLTSCQAQLVPENGMGVLAQRRPRPARLAGGAGEHRSHCRHDHCRLRFE